MDDDEDALPSEEDSEKPRYLLPEGCKDLIDVLRRLRARRERRGPTGFFFDESIAPIVDVPKTLTNLTLPGAIPVRHLAFLLGQKPFQIIGLLMQMNIFATIHQEIDFATAADICAAFGVRATQAE